MSIFLATTRITLCCSQIKTSAADMQQRSRGAAVISGKSASRRSNVHQSGHHTHQVILQAGHVTKSRDCQTQKWPGAQSFTLLNSASAASAEAARCLHRGQSISSQMLAMWAVRCWIPGTPLAKAPATCSSKQGCQAIALVQCGQH